MSKIDSIIGISLGKRSISGGGAGNNMGYGKYSGNYSHQAPHHHQQQQQQQQHQQQQPNFNHPPQWNNNGSQPWDAYSQLV